MNIQEAKELAEKWHQGQKRWNGEPYINHLKRVAESFSFIYSRERIVSLLHDILEDTNIKREQLIEAGVKLEDLRSIEILTRIKGVSYLDYILEIKKDSIARLVKIADIEDNLRDLKDGSMKDKYLLALHILKK